MLLNDTGVKSYTQIGHGFLQNGTQLVQQVALAVELFKQDIYQQSYL